ncbi:MAG: response regulator, partial [Lachnospiraceae bacterium]|nr:response regulator [Lachnospiraceae bacterium]
MKKIFLVEDDKTISKNLSLLLRSEEFTVHHASTQMEAFSMLTAHKFDLALVDISLP